MSSKNIEYQRLSKKNGINHGPYTVHYGDEKLQVREDGFFKNGIKDGYYRMFYYTGERRLYGELVEHSFRHYCWFNSKDYTISFQGDSEEGIFVNGQKHGPYYYFFVDDEYSDSRREKGSYIKGKRNELFRHFFGTSYIEGIYKDDKIIKSSVYFDNIDKWNYPQEKSDYDDFQMDMINKPHLDTESYKNYSVHIIGSELPGHRNEVFEYNNDNVLLNGSIYHGYWKKDIHHPLLHPMEDDLLEGEFRYGKKYGIWKSYNKYHDTIDSVFYFSDELFWDIDLEQNKGFDGWLTWDINIPDNDKDTHRIDLIKENENNSDKTKEDLLPF